VRTFFGQVGTGSSDADVLTFCRKNFGFFEIYGMSVLTRGAEPVRIREEGSIFRDFVRTSYMDGLESLCL